MFTKHNIIPSLLEVSPSFEPVWNDFLKEWKEDDDELPLYLLFDDFTRYIDDLVGLEKCKELEGIFFLVEQWHFKGDSYVQEIATIGLLENLQNTNIVKKNSPKIIESYLLPKSLEQWKKVYEFWEKGNLISQ